MKKDKNYNVLLIFLILSVILNIFLLFPKLGKTLNNSIGISKNAALEDKPTSKKVFPESNIEWFNLYSKLSAGGLKEFITTWKTEGTVLKISNIPGDKEGFKEYYTGNKKGFFHFAGEISLMYKNGRKINWALSDRRMSLLKVYDMTASGPLEKTFNDIKIGDRLETEESVDLAVSNINDENVKYLTIRILH